MCTVDSVYSSLSLIKWEDCFYGLVLYMHFSFVSMCCLLEIRPLFIMICSTLKCVICNEMSLFCTYKILEFDMDGVLVNLIDLLSSHYVNSWISWFNYKRQLWWNETYRFQISYQIYRVWYWNLEWNADYTVWECFRNGLWVWKCLHC